MEKPSSDTNHTLSEEEVKPIQFPDGTIELDHSDITLATCSLFISIKIHHQEGFFYEVYFRDQKYKVLQTKIIESYECSVDKENTIVWHIEDVNPGEEYNVNCISKAPNGELKPLCLTCKVRAPCTRPGFSPLLLKSKSRKDIVLKWKPPRTNGKEIDGYTIFMSDGFLNMPSEVTLSTPLVEKEKVKECKATKLKSGFYYAFQLTSYNACGETVNPIQWFQTQASVPSVPSSPVASCIGCDSIVLEWHDLTQEECNGSEIQHYFLQMSEGNNGWNAVYSDRKPTVTVTQLKYRTTYAFRLSAHNGEGDSPFSPVVEFTTAIGKPPAPHVEPLQTSKRQGKNVLSFSWSCDRENIDLVDNFTVKIERSSDNTVVLQQECESSPFAVSTLLPGCSYLFSVNCHSVGGWGPFSKPLLFTTPSTSPALLIPPSIQSTIQTPLTKGNREYNIQATVTWEKGDSNGEEIDSYVVEMKSLDPAKEEATIQAIHTLPTHPPEKNYAIEVGQYCTVVGSSESFWIYSIEDSEVRLIQTGPSPKYRIVNKDSIIIDHYPFTCSSKQSGIPETDLLTLYSPHPVYSKWTTIQEVSSQSTTIHHLLPNTSYALHILPRNACGLASNYVDVNFTTPAGPLPQPSQPVVTNISSSSIALDMTPPITYNYRGNDPASIEYYVECDTTQTGVYECVYRGTQSHCILSSLQSGSIYHMRVAYLSANGNSPYSSPLSVATKPSSPEPPESLHLGKLEEFYNPLTFALVEWSSPASDHGSPVLQYYIELAQVKKESKHSYTRVGVTNTNSLLLRDLVAGGHYAVRVQCDNKYGVSNVSAPFYFTTGSLAPDQMDSPILARKPTEKAATIRWSEPTNNGSPILGYRIRVEPIGREYNVKPEVKSQTINKLTNETEYSVTIIAINSAGESPTSEPLVFVTDSHSIMAPAVTSFKPIQRKENRVQITWHEAVDNGAVIQKYQLFESNNIIYEGIERTYEFTAELGKHYSFQVRAVNVMGAGDLSEECELYIPPPTVEKKIIKTKNPRIPKTKGQGFENVKNERVEAILEKSSKKKFAKLKQWWKDYRMIVFFIVFVWVSIQLFKPIH